MASIRLSGKPSDDADMTEYRTRIRRKRLQGGSEYQQQTSYTDETDEFPGSNQTTTLLPAFIP